MYICLNSMTIQESILLYQANSFWNVFVFGGGGGALNAIYFKK